MPLRTKLKICGVNFNNLSQLECVEVFKAHAAKDEGSLFIITPNVDFVVRSNKDAEFREIIAQADLSVCESVIVFNSGILLGRRFKAKITGNDASVMLFNQAQERHDGVFLLGSDASTIKLAEEKLAAAYPGMIISGIHNGYFDLEKSAEIVRQINASGAKYLFVGMGSPRQEQWVHKHRAELTNIRFIICIGGLFDIFSGKVKRAPLFIQYYGMEWAWRLMHEPRRLWKRYLIYDMSYFGLLFKEFFQRHPAILR